MPDRVEPRRPAHATGQPVPAAAIPGAAPASLPAPIPAHAPAPPTRAQLEAARGALIPDLVSPGMRVLLCGINPSLWSGYAGYHFARPANRLWVTLEQAGFTPRRLHPADIDDIRSAGIGITDLVGRATARADELDAAEVRAGLEGLAGTVARWQPQHVAVLGIGAYRLAFHDRRAIIGRQDRTLGGAAVWALPNPSGLNAHYGQAALTAEFAALAVAAGYRAGAFDSPERRIEV